MMIMVSRAAGCVRLVARRIFGLRDARRAQDSVLYLVASFAAGTAEVVDYWGGAGVAADGGVPRRVELQPAKNVRHARKTIDGETVHGFAVMLVHFFNFVFCETRANDRSAQARA